MPRFREQGHLTALLMLRVTLRDHAHPRGHVLAEGVEIPSETCRVPQVESVAINDEGNPAGEKAAQWLDDRIRVLLPLTLPMLSSDPRQNGGSAVHRACYHYPQQRKEGQRDDRPDPKTIPASASGRMVARFFKGISSAGRDRRAGSRADGKRRSPAAGMDHARGSS